MDSDVKVAAVPAIEFLGVDKRFAARGKAAEVLAARAEVAGELVEFVFRVQLMSSPKCRGKSHE